MKTIKSFQFLTVAASAIVAIASLSFAGVKADAQSATRGVQSAAADRHVSGQVFVNDLPLPGGGNPPIPASYILDVPLTGGGDPPVPAYYLMDVPLTGGGDPPVPLSYILDVPLTGGGDPPVPSFSILDLPLTGGGYPPTPPSAPVVVLTDAFAVYLDGTIGFANGDYLYANGTYMWADGFVRFSSAPGAYMWTDGNGHQVSTSIGDVAPNGLPHIRLVAASNN